jgi:hypothetical protein
MKRGPLFVMENSELWDGPKLLQSEANRRNRPHEQSIPFSI